MSTLGDGLRYVAFPLLAAGLTTDPRAVASVFVAGYLPWPLFGLLGGAVVDRHDRRSVMWTTDTVRAVVVGAFTAVLVTSATTIVSLAVLSFLLGAAETLFDNAASAIVPQLVAPGGLERANSWLNGVQTVNSKLIGAPIGAFLYGVARYLPTAADAVSFVPAAALVWSLPGRYRPASSTSRTSLGADIGAGLRWLSRHRFLRTACLLLIVINGTLGAGEAVLVLYARSTLGLSNPGYTVLFVTLAVGAIFGTVIAPAIRRRVDLRPVVVSAAVGKPTPRQPAASAPPEPFAGSSAAGIFSSREQTDSPMPVRVAMSRTGTFSRRSSASPAAVSRSASSTFPSAAVRSCHASSAAATRLIAGPRPPVLSAASASSAATPVSTTTPSGSTPDPAPISRPPFPRCSRQRPARTLATPDFAALPVAATPDLHPRR